MPRLTDTYSAIGAEASPVRVAQVDAARYVLEDTARDLRTEAKLKARVAPDEGEGPAHQAAVLDQALAILVELGGGPAAPLATTAEPPKPVVHVCDQPGCGTPASNGFGLGDGPQRWACGPHAATIEALWTTEHADWLAEQERKRREGEERLRERRTDLGGLNGRMI